MIRSQTGTAQGYWQGRQMVPHEWAGSLKWRCATHPHGVVVAGSGKIAAIWRPSNICRVSASAMGHMNTGSWLSPAAAQLQAGQFCLCTERLS